MYNNLNNIPLLRLLLPFITGIVWSVFYQPNFEFVVIYFGITSTTFSCILLIKKINFNYQLRWILGIIIYVSIFLGAASLTSYHSKDSVSISNTLKNKNNKQIIGEIISPTQVKTKSIKAIVKIKRLKRKNQWIPGKGKVIIYLQKDTLSKQLEVGDAIAFQQQLKNISPPKNPNEFDYSKYLSFHSIHQQAYLKSKSWRLYNKRNSLSLLKFANKSRNQFITILKQKGLRDEDLAVACALILGFKEAIDTELKSAYSSAGAMHVLAVSGLHVGVIFLIFSQLFSFIGRIKYGEIIKGISLISVLWAYALLTGLSPSVMRAATMFSFIIVAKMTNRNSNIFNTLAASAFCLLIYKPLLIMEVGFQLSYLAVIGIVIIQPWINRWFNFRYKIPKIIWEITSVSIAAQIATFPLGLLYFHQFPNYFLLSNLIVIPMAVIILYLGILTLSFSFVPLLDNIMATCLKYSIQFLNYSVNFIDQLPNSISENIRFGMLDTWLIYLFIASLITLIVYRKFIFLLLGGTFLSFFLISTLWTTTKTLQQRKLIIYNIPKHTAINFIDGVDNFLITNKSLIENKKKLMFHVQNNWINNGLKKAIIVELKQDQNSITKNNLYVKSYFFQFHELKIALIDRPLIVRESQKKLQIDLLILTKNNQLSIAKLLTQFNPKQIIIDPSNTKYQNTKLLKEAQKLKVNCWSVLTEGYYEYQLKDLKSI